MANPKKISCWILVDPADRLESLFNSVSADILSKSNGILQMEFTRPGHQSLSNVVSGIVTGAIPCAIVYSKIITETKSTSTTFFFNPVWSQNEQPGSKILVQTERYYQSLLRSLPATGKFFQREIHDDEKIISSILNHWPKRTNVLDIGPVGPEIKKAQIDAFYSSVIGREDIMVLPINLCYRCNNSIYETAMIVNEGTWNFLKTNEKKLLREALVNPDNISKIKTQD
jgi:hypothetical protein